MGASKKEGNLTPFPFSENTGTCMYITHFVRKKQILFTLFLKHFVLLLQVRNLTLLKKGKKLDNVKIKKTQSS